MAELLKTRDLTDAAQHGWAARGAVMISIWFDPADHGSLRQRVSYER